MAESGEQAGEEETVVEEVIIVEEEPLVDEDLAAGPRHARSVRDLLWSLGRWPGLHTARRLPRLGRQWPGRGCPGCSATATRGTLPARRGDSTPHHRRSAGSLHRRLLCR